MGKLLFSILSNAALSVMTLRAVLNVTHINEAEEGKRTAAFRYFTTDSNILSGLAALIVVIYNIRMLANGDILLPAWVIVLKYVGTVSVTVTFLTVVFFLGPTQGYKEMFTGDGLYLHLICPLLAILSLCIFDAGANLTLWQALAGVLPTFIYGVLYFIKVVAIGESKGGWKDFYGFNHNGKWAFSMVLMLIATGAICSLLRLLYNAIP